MQALILAAGFATRLQPLSFLRPKVLIPICNKPLLDIFINYLATSGIKHIGINTHHLGKEIEKYIQEFKLPADISLFHEPSILGTGGGICRMAKEMTSSSLVILNGDILCNIDLPFVMKRHIESGAKVTLVLIDSPLYNRVAVNRRERIIAFGNKAIEKTSSNPDLRLLAFTGIHIADRKMLLDYAPPKTFFSILEVYENAMKAGERIEALVMPDISWQEVGSIKGYWNTHRRLAKNPDDFFPWFTFVTFPVIDKNATIQPSVKTSGIVCVGEKSVIEKGVILKDVIIWDKARIEKDVQLQNCIVSDGCVVKKSARDTILCDVYCKPA